MTDDGPNQCDCKVGRLIETYDLHGLNAELRERRERDELSLRDLADLVNTRVLEAALESTDVDVVGDPESVYEALAGDDVEPERRADVRDRLNYAGIDVSDVTADFVSHQTIRSHLVDCLGVDTSRRGVTDLEEGRDVIAWAREREEDIVDRTLARLRRVGALETSELNVTHSVRVTCTECNERYSVEELLDRGGCECDVE